VASVGDMPMGIRVDHSGAMGVGRIFSRGGIRRFFLDFSSGGQKW